MRQFAIVLTTACHCSVFWVTWIQSTYCHVFSVNMNFNIGWRERETNKMLLIWCLLSNFYLNIFRGSLCPSSGEQDCVLPHMVFLKMGIMMPETCCDRSLIINIRLVASCWFLSLHPTSIMQDHRSLRKWILILASNRASHYSNGLFPSDFPSKILHVRLLYPTCARCSARFILLDFLILKQIMNLLTSPSCYLLSLRSNYSPEHPILDHLPPMSFF